mmetsp:Transcript_34207/g.86531  ORF Transcript_34207/g.86531 Transcript_34207/m.86531 type:complete len:317 (-) Transcript_34207:571-1521(-)
MTCCVLSRSSSSSPSSSPPPTMLAPMRPVPSCRLLTSCSSPRVHSAPFATSLVRLLSVVARMLRIASTRPGVEMITLRLFSVKARFHSADSAKRCAASLLWCLPNSTSPKISMPLLAAMSSLFLSFTVKLARPWHSFQTVQKMPWRMEPWQAASRTCSISTTNDSSSCSRGLPSSCPTRHATATAALMRDAGSFSCLMMSARTSTAPALISSPWFFVLCARLRSTAAARVCDPVPTLCPTSTLASFCSSVLHKETRVGTMPLEMMCSCVASLKAARPVSRKSMAHCSSASLVRGSWIAIFSTIPAAAICWHVTLFL